MQFDIVRAWKEEGYRQSLSEDQRNMLPASPVGELELTDTDLKAIYGGWDGSSDGGNGCSQRVGSLPSICEINLYTLNLLNIPLLNSGVRVCEKG
jgi:mersacidin/lichenicidin family type 2 lantibiotic